MREASKDKTRLEHIQNDLPNLETHIKDYLQDL